LGLLKKKNSLFRGCPSGSSQKKEYQWILIYSLDVEDGVGGVHGGSVLGGLTDQTLLLGERDERRGGVRTLVVGDWVNVSIELERIGDLS
jgi:hypothetical protein